VRAAVGKTSVPVVDCGVVVLITGRSHRASRVLLKDYLRIADYDVEFALDRSEADLILNDVNGFTVTVAIALLTAHSFAPLRPHIPGTWLARRMFMVSPERDETSFSPEALTPQIRDHYGLPAGTMRYIRIETDDLMEEEHIGDAVRVYVDPDVLSLLLANPTDSVSVQMQVELAIQATTAVAAAVVNELRDDNGKVDATGLDDHDAAKRFIDTLATTLKIGVADVLNLATEAPLLSSHLEAAFGLRRATVSMLKEN
jgi:hypothetical protein